MSMPAPAPNPTPVAAAAPADASARSFLATLGGALSDLATLRIVTVVGDVSVSGAGEATAVTARDGGTVEAASTEIHMLDGHIVNVFSPKFSSAGDGALYGFHQAQVAGSVRMFGDHLAALKALATDLLQTRR